jgi:hypothetical protein
MVKSNQNEFVNVKGRNMLSLLDKLDKSVLPIFDRVDIKVARHNRLNLLGLMRSLNEVYGKNL